jgi:cytochrome bd-type quinol oxidase subunit 2
MKSILRKIGFSFSVLFAAMTIMTPAFVSAQLFDGAVDQACEGATVGGSCNEAEASQKVNSTIATVINIFSVIVGVAAVIMIIIGGFRYITSSGDSASVNSAKNTILYAIIGLVIVALAQVIVRFVLNQVS